MREEITGAVKEQLQSVVESFAGVLSFEVHPGLSEQENVKKIIEQTATVCAVIGCVTRIPLSDVVFLTPIHVKMTLHIAKAKGFEITKERALDILRELLSTVGLSLTGLYIASFVKVIPIVDVIFYVPIVYGTTYGLGRVVEGYFHGLKTGVIPSADDLRELFKREMSRGKVEGASLGKAQLDKAYAELKRKVDERTQKKAPPAEPEKGHTPLGIRIKEKLVRRPVEKTMGDEAPLAKEPVPEKAEEPPPAFEAKKTIGPATPASGIDIKVGIHEKTIGNAEPPPPPPAPPPAPAPAAPAADGKAKLLDDLERLAKLKEMGALTAEEFELAKKKLLA